MRIVPIESTRQRRPRKESHGHLAWIRTLPCLICGDNTSTEAAHIRMQDNRFAKRETGKGEKPDDKWVIPLCGKHHRQQHEWGEAPFWRSTEYRHIDPIIVAAGLSLNSGDTETACTILRRQGSEQA